MILGCHFMLKKEIDWRVCLWVRTFQLVAFAVEGLHRNSTLWWSHRSQLPVCAFGTSWFRGGVKAPVGAQGEGWCELVHRLSGSLTEEEGWMMFPVCGWTLSTSPGFIWLSHPGPQLCWWVEAREHLPLTVLSIQSQGRREQAPAVGSRPIGDWTLLIGESGHFQALSVFQTCIWMASVCPTACTHLSVPLRLRVLEEYLGFF